MAVMRRVLAPFRETVGFSRWMLLAGIVIVAFFVVLAVGAEWIAPYGYAQKSADGVDFPKLAEPGGDHLLGTDRLFFDVWSRVVWGARTALEVIVLAVAGSMILGLALGLVSGYVGGWFDRILVLVMDALYAFPPLLLAIVFGFLLADKIGAGVVSAALSLTVVYLPQYFRVVRNSTISARESTYVEAARALGAPGRTVITRYLFGNVIHSVPVIGTLNAADALGTLAALGFLGLGIQPTDGADWGFDLSRALDDASSGIWWTGVFSGAAIVLLITGLTLVGEGLNETINPVLRKKRLQKIRREETIR
ncbi:ABC transporter permease [Nocardioides sp. YIM 152315]|uniref:ABC transporter permease n=1 Tax=Nocardioides sp. YIM 152315 TaxID=3031760 RepID=UPI0023D9BB3C|nr:ABC transporter permease [Nocardioides sp. YIM 152315]MDF1602606.1 ABC transporter permease [Nocardioides sp. YIM 152315]